MYTYVNNNTYNTNNNYIYINIIIYTVYICIAAHDLVVPSSGSPGRSPGLHWKMLLPAIRKVHVAVHVLRAVSAPVESHEFPHKEISHWWLTYPEK